MNKTEDEAHNLIQEIMPNNCQQSNKRTPSKKAKGKFNVDSLTLVTAIIDAMTQRLDRLYVNTVNACAPLLRVIVLDLLTI